jgi:hypothetical protein
MGFAIDRIERLSLQTAIADTTGKTGYVEHTVHGRATRAFTHDLQTAIGTHSCARRSEEKQRECVCVCVLCINSKGQAGHKAERGKNKYINVLDGYLCSQ